MIFSPPRIAAVAIPVSGSGLAKPLEGIGRVVRQIDAATYSIKIEGRSMLVRVTEGAPEGALNVGQRVSVKLQSGALVIEQLGSQAAGQNLSDLFTLNSGTSMQSCKTAINSVITAIDANPEDRRTYRQCSSIVAALSGGLSSIDAKLTEAVLRRFGELAAGPDDAPIPADDAKEIVRMLKQIAAAIPESKNTVPLPDRSVTLEKTLPSGLYSFTSVDEALRVLNLDKASNEPFVRELEKRLSEDGVIVVRATAGPGNTTVATLLQPEELQREFESWQAFGFASRAFQSIPIGVFEQLLNDRGSVNLDLLRTLDAMAEALQLPAASARAGSRAAQEAALVQWLNAAATAADRPSVPLVSLLPVFSASSIIDALEELSATLAQLPSESALPALPQPENFSLTGRSVADAPDKASLLCDAFKRLGLDLEHTLQTTGAIDKTSLKAVLLELIKTIVPEKQLPTVSTPDIRQNTIALMEAFKEKLLIVINQSFPSAVPGTPFVKTAGQTPGDLYARFKQDVSRLLDAPLGKIAELLEKMIAGKNSLPEAQLSLVNEANGRINLLARDLEDIVRQQADLLITSIQTKSGSDQASLVQNAVQPLRSALEKSVADLLRMVEVFRPGVIRAVESLVKEPAQAAEHKAVPPAKTGSAPAGAAAPAVSPGGEPEDVAALRQTVQQQLETLVSRVESLQLLARQVETAGGNQQIVALPVKVGGEWTEMQVRFVRRRSQTKTKGQGQHYTVHLNVSPSLLGAIHAKLDYQEKKSLSATIDFESDDTRKWFVARKNDLRNSLVALGMPSPRIELCPASAAESLRLRRQADTFGRGTVSPLSNTLIDMKA